MSLPCPWIETPLVESAALSKIAGCRIFLKLENLQPSGSFKSRGIGNFIRTALATHPEPHFYISSGGNAGLAAIAASLKFGRPCSVVVPMSTKPMMIEKCKLAGATEVLQHGASWQEADNYLREYMQKDPHGIYVPPFDHPDVWTGASTMIEEIRAQLHNHMGNTRLPEDNGSETDPDGIVCCVGGGGLFCGIMQGLGEKSKTKVIAVETFGAESLYESVKNGKLVTLPGITSIATSLGAVRVAPKALEYAMRESQGRKSVQTALVTDAEAVEACWHFAQDERLIVEPACGATLAIAYKDRLRRIIPNFNEDSKVVLIVCGGSNITVDMLVNYREAYGF